MVSERRNLRPPLCLRRLRPDPGAADPAADSAARRRGGLGQDLPLRLARRRRGARGREGLGRRGGRGPAPAPASATRRLLGGRLRPSPLHDEKARLMRYLPLADADRSDMLRTIGASSVEDLFADVPEAARLPGRIEGLPDHASEMAVERKLSAMARRNLVAGDAPFFLGCGAYRHHIPASVDHLIQRGEFLTSYTPYQPEIAQGTLQALFEFQTQVARLYGCEVANTSMYDGSTACGAPVGMARRITRRSKAILSAGLHPHYVSVANTMARFTGDQLETALPELGAETDMARLLDRVDGETSCVVVQYPDILG